MDRPAIRHLDQTLTIAVGPAKKVRCGGAETRGSPGLLSDYPAVFR
jgi:hypothetical protein